MLNLIQKTFVSKKIDIEDAFSDWFIMNEDNLFVVPFSDLNTALSILTKFYREAYGIERVVPSKYYKSKLNEEFVNDSSSGIGLHKLYYPMSLGQLKYADNLDSVQSLTEKPIILEVSDFIYGERNVLNELAEGSVVLVHFDEDSLIPNLDGGFIFTKSYEDYKILVKYARMYKDKLNPVQLISMTLVYFSYDYVSAIFDEARKIKTKMKEKLSEKGVATLESNWYPGFLFIVVSEQETNPIYPLEIRRHLAQQGLRTLRTLNFVDHYNSDEELDDLIDKVVEKLVKEDENERDNSGIGSFVEREDNDSHDDEPEVEGEVR